MSYLRRKVEIITGGGIMTTIPKKVADRLNSAVPKFQRILQVAKDRDLNESDTVSILNDILAEVFGYDKYLEVTSELMIRGTYCDLAIKIDNKIQFLLEAKAVNIELKDNHVKQAIDYGANKGIQWVILTNGIEWRLYRIRFEQPINYDFVFNLNFLTISSKADKDKELMFLICKEGLQKSAREDYHEKIQSINKYVIGNLILSRAVVNNLRKELRKLSKGIRVEENDIKQIIRNEVLKREIFEGEDAIRAQQKVSKLYKKNANKNHNTTPAISDTMIKQESLHEMSITKQLLKEAEDKN